MFTETTLRTARLILRPFDASDIEETRASCADPLIQRWLPLPQPCTREDAAAWCTKIAHSLRESGDGIHFAVTEAGTGRPAGTTGLKRTDWAARVSEVGYWVSAWARGRGTATEATREVGRRLLTEQGFERLEVRAATQNAASRKVALKAGTRHEGVLRNAGFVHAGRIDLDLFSLVPGDLAATDDGREERPAT
ncbi:GNAT family N-acetyltransferase [Streptomyces sp. NPDC049954]|uniref:GNAT family N-acetyltransferase n=1 Tax=Streptomyces sp. NPDC049954 TaxID=3155779 RepID=UPI0034249F54